jgi:poly(hydroxyalkanoate) depolymerase family esterase
LKGILFLVACVAGLLDAQAPMVRRTFVSPLGARDFLIYRPANFPAGSGNRSLVVVLHGCSQSAEDIARDTRMNAAAAQNGFLAIYPEQAAAANPRRCWNWFTAEQSTRDHGEAGLLAALIDSVAFAEGVSEQHVSLVGMAEGASMAANLVLAYPERYGALAMHSGIPALAAHDIMSELAAAKNSLGEGGALGVAAWTAMGHYARPVPVIVLHGADDKAVSPKNLALNVQQWTAINAHGVKAPVVSQLLPGVGHAWSGGAAAPSGPDATQSIVAFFKRVGAISALAQ